MKRHRLNPTKASKPKVRPFGLTERELEVLREVSHGLPDREIARKLFISYKTVTVHVTNILRKLEAGNRTRAAAMAHESGLFDD